MAVRGIRGATTVEIDASEEIIAATTELLQELIAANAIEPSEVAGAWFTTTRDLVAEFPAIAARRLGWISVPLLCGHEMEVTGANPRSIPHCIRVLILLNTDRTAADMKFVYQRRAEGIQSDLEEMRSAFRPAEGEAP